MSESCYKLFQVDCKLGEIASQRLNRRPLTRANRQRQLPGDAKVPTITKTPGDDVADSPGRDPTAAGRPLTNLTLHYDCLICAANYTSVITPVLAPNDRFDPQLVEHPHEQVGQRRVVLRS